MKALWEILIPSADEQTVKDWYAFVRQFSDGITILKDAKGEWVSPSGIFFEDYMIPIRIICTEGEINLIVDHTVKFFCQESVLAYMLSDNIILRSKEELERWS
jgi:hypothetical protein